jgi:hypothetical protein
MIMIALGAPSLQRSSLASAFPTPSGCTFLTHDSLVQPFKYWDEGLHDGIFYQSDLYGKGDCYALTERDQAFDDAAQHTALGKRVCITVSDQGYTLWVSLKIAPQATSATI